MIRFICNKCNDTLELTKATIKNIDGVEFKEKYGFECPIGVNGRNSDNTLYFDKMGWVVSQPLIIGMGKTYEWIKKQID